VQVGDPPIGGRYTLVAPFGADERFAGGKVQTWRARDPLVERDVVLRVIKPGGASAKLFIDRALEMRLIAHPGLGVVYDAVDHGEFAIVVCEWIDGRSLAETVAAHGPLDPPTACQAIGDVAEAISAAHHAGLPIGGITAERVVLRDNAAVTVAAVPALFADERGDIQQLGSLLYTALTGQQPDLDDRDLAQHVPRGVPRDLAVLCQRALDQDPARQLGSAAAFAAVLRPRTRPQSSSESAAGRTGGRPGSSDSDPSPPARDTAPAGKPKSGTGASRSPGTTRPAQLPVAAAAPTVAITLPTAAAGQGLGPGAPASAGEADAEGAAEAVPEPGGPPGPDGASRTGTAKAAKPSRTTSEIPLGAVAPGSGSNDSARDSGTSPIDFSADDYDPWQDDDSGAWGGYDDDDDTDSGGPHEGSQTRRKVLLYAVPLAALILVVLLAVYVGKQFSAAVTDSNDAALVPSTQAPAGGTTPVESEATEATEAPGAPVQLPPVSVAVYDPFGDGQPENNDDVGLSNDGDVGSAWQTLIYQNTPEFGNLKPGVGVIFDLGEERTINSIELATTLPGSSIEVRVGAAPDAPLDSYRVVGTLDPFPESGSVSLAEPTRARFVIIWFIRLVESDGGFRGALAECRILGT